MPKKSSWVAHGLGIFSPAQARARPKKVLSSLGPRLTPRKDQPGHHGQPEGVEAEKECRRIEREDRELEAYTPRDERDIVSSGWRRLAKRSKCWSYEG